MRSFEQVFGTGALLGMITSAPVRAAAASRRGGEARGGGGVERGQGGEARGVGRDSCPERVHRADRGCHEGPWFVPGPHRRPGRGEPHSTKALGCVILATHGTRAHAL